MPPRDTFFGTSGPRTTDIVVIGEAWGAQESLDQVPLVGASGQEFTKMLAEAGIDRSRLFLTNITASKPFNNQMWSLFDEENGPLLINGLRPGPELTSEIARLEAQLSALSPKLIIGLGNYPLWLLSNVASISKAPDNPAAHVPSGIGNYRGSMLYANVGLLSSRVSSDIPFLPIYHPAAILRAWKNRAITIHDLKFRVPMALSGNWRPVPKPVLVAPPTFSETVEYLRALLCRLWTLPTRVTIDIETHSRRFITCIGICSELEPKVAISIPLVWLHGEHSARSFTPYWTPDEEFEILRLVRLVLRHEHALIEGQNFIYDTQHIETELGVVPSFDFDTMLAHHLILPGTRQALGYLSSIYCRHHVFWKDDNKEWATTGTLEQHLTYNATDCLHQYEIATRLREIIAASPALAEKWAFEKYKHHLALRMMRRGIAVNNRRRKDMTIELVGLSETLTTWFHRVAPQDLIKEKAKTPWFRSSQQTMHVFYDMLGLPVVLHRKTKRPTFGKEAIKSLRLRYIGLRPLFDRLAALRSFTNLQKNFLSVGLEPDGAMRCAYRPGGTSTFRWASSANAFGRGTNMQNIPKGKLTDLELSLDSPIVESLPEEDEPDDQDLPG